MSTPGMSHPVRNRETWRVLYVEDSAQDAKLCGRQLEHAGYKPLIDIVASAEEFEKALRENSYDIVLADYNLPTWSGMAALESLQRDGRDIPFILVTGTVGEEVAVECIKRGATDYVLKDRVARLPLAIERALEEKRLRVERRLAERSRDLLAAIVQSSDDAIISTDLEGAIVSWNRGAERMYGYGAEEARAKPISLLFPADSGDEPHAVRDAFANGESLDHYETKGKRKDGAVIDISVTVSRVHSADGSLTGRSMIARDITEHKRLQKEFFVTQKMDAIGRLAAGVAHDFNNLLTVIASYSALMLDDMSENNEMYAGLREIEKAGEKAAALTRQLLAFCRKQVLEPKALNINAIVADMDRMLRRLISEDIDLVTILEPALWSVKADPGHIEQVVMNLAVNARDAMVIGGKLTIETANIEFDSAFTHRHTAVLPGAYVLLAITDTGTGMDDETQARIFEPFFTTKSPGEGTGLGLATVYGIVQQSAGSVLVYSELGHGTAFKIYLPRIQEAPAARESPVQPSPYQGTETILVAEDEDVIRAMVCRVLKKSGYTVLEAKNGTEALLIAERHSSRIDLMITDVVMPSMGGGELAETLTASRPGMKVLFMSGYTNNAIICNGVLAPNTAFLEKPFVPKTLSRKVREVLGRE
jgi:PAS domain S-box-containing protein